MLEATPAPCGTTAQTTLQHCLFRHAAHHDDIYVEVDICRKWSFDILTGGW